MYVESPRPLSASERRQKRSQSEARNFNHDNILDPMEPIFFNKYAIHGDNIDDEIFTIPKSHRGKVYYSIHYNRLLLSPNV